MALVFPYKTGSTASIWAGLGKSSFISIKFYKYILNIFITILTVWLSRSLYSLS